MSTAIVANSAFGATIGVSQFLPYSTPPSVDSWYLTDVRPGGTATIPSLSGAGGLLESGQPLPTGAARLTTINSTSAKAEVGTFADFGLASSVFSSLNLSYSYYKTATGELFAAPAVKLTIYNPGGTGDNYGTLVYEPTWNQGVNGSVAVPTGSWQTVSIDQATGAGSDAGGGWWWNGGFELANTAGGPPVRSLSEWLTAFQASDPTDFAAAHVIALSMGVGSYNVNQDDYFDAVSIRTVGIDKTYDFGAAPVPEPSTYLAGLSALGMLGLFSWRNRK